MEEVNLLREQELRKQHCKAMKDQVMMKIGRILENYENFNLAIQEFAHEMKEDGSQIADEDLEEFRSVANGKIVEIVALEEDIEKLCVPIRADQNLSDEQLIKWNEMKATYSELSDSLIQLRIRWEGSLQSLGELMINGELNEKQNPSSEPKVVQDEANSIAPSELEAASAQGLGKEAEIATLNDRQAQKSEMIPGSSRQRIDSENLDDLASKSDGGNASPLRDTKPSATDLNRKDTKQSFTKETFEFGQKADKVHDKVHHILQGLYTTMCINETEAEEIGHSRDVKEFWSRSKDTIMNILALNIKSHSQWVIISESPMFKADEFVLDISIEMRKLSHIVDIYCHFAKKLLELRDHWKNFLLTWRLSSDDTNELFACVDLSDSLSNPWNDALFGPDGRKFQMAHFKFMNKIYDRLFWITNNWAFRGFVIPIKPCQFRQFRAIVKERRGPDSDTDDDISDGLAKTSDTILDPTCTMTVSENHDNSTAHYTIGNPIMPPIKKLSSAKDELLAENFENAVSMKSGELNGKQNQTSEPKVVPDEAIPIEPSQLEAVSSQELGKHAEIATRNDGLAQITEMTPGPSRRKIDSENADELASKSDGANDMALRVTKASVIEKNRMDTKQGFSKEITVNEYNRAKENDNSQITNILEHLQGRMRVDAASVMNKDNDSELKEFWRLAEQKLCQLKGLHTKVQSEREIVLNAVIAFPNKMSKPHLGRNSQFNKMMEAYFDLFGLLVELECSLESRGLFKGGELKFSDYEGIYEALTAHKCSKLGWDGAEFRSADCFLMKEIHSRLLWISQHWKTDDELLPENIETVVTIKSDDAAQSDVEAPGESGNVEADHQSETLIHADVADD